MKVAICGNPPLALQVQAGLQNSGIEFKFFIRDFVSMWGGGNLTVNLPPISFFEFRRLVNAGELDGVIIAEDGRKDFTRIVVQACKLYEIPKVGIMDLTFFSPLFPIHWLDTEKAYLTQLETNIIDGCNLNCKGCAHFAGLFKTNEVYNLETFRRDMRQLSQVCDVATFFLLGGEPLLLKNLDEYMKISRQYLPKSDLRVVTNGLLVPSVEQKTLDAIRENNFFVSISNYPPTAKMLDKIKNVLDANKIRYQVRKAVEDKGGFNVFMTFSARNNPSKSRAVCCNNTCRFMRNGKIYKCPPDALSYRFAERFGVKNFPKATGVDLYASNFASLIPMLNDNIEMCHWCSEKVRQIPWETSNKPKLEDWLANPDEIKNFA